MKYYYLDKEKIDFLCNNEKIPLSKLLNGCPFETYERLAEMYKGERTVTPAVQDYLRQLFKSENNGDFCSDRLPPSFPVETKSDIKPCPFCGKTQIIIDSQEHTDRDNSYRFTAKVFCSYCNGTMPTQGFEKSREEAEALAVKAWNRRLQTC